ncbi:cell adhesion molecule DSCAML1-like [Leptodactylus fuscus]|uniref:cell adhesion molecule DSCAML1-like n=1 Tax=Leptodactylus fuscus TaxID=238119 RepID=UPI003F4F12DE
MVPTIVVRCPLFPVIVFLAVTAGLSGSTVRPVVTFSPLWHKILYGEPITMTCDLDGAVQGDVTYTWYRNNQWIQQGKTFIIESAESIHGGNYQCGTSAEDISEEVTLYVMHGLVALQSPPYIYEGDDLALRCHSRYKDIRGAIEFYRNNELIHSSTTDSEILYRDHINVTAVYKCTRQVTASDYNIHSVTAPDHFLTDRSSASVMVTFSPNWKQIFTGDSVTITCDVINYGRYSWYKDNRLLRENQKSINIDSAQRSDSGKYQCETSSGRSPEASLEVSDALVILQAPLIYDGSIPYLRCHSRPEYPVRWTKFYKDGEFLQESEDGRLFLKQSLLPGRYRCEKKLYGVPLYLNDSASSVPIRDLFSRPEIRLTPSNVTEGDNMTLTCDTRLSPQRQTTELQFAFYRDGREVRGFLSSNKYVLSAKLEDSGNYSCAGKTGDNRVRKVSEELHVQRYKTISRLVLYCFYGTIHVISGCIHTVTVTPASPALALLNYNEKIIYAFI